MDEAGGTTALRIRFFSTVNDPARSANRDGSEDVGLLEGAGRLVSRATVRVRIDANELTTTAVFLRTLSALLLSGLRRIMLVLPALLLNGLTDRSLRLCNAEVTRNVGHVTSAVSGAHLVVDLLIRRTLRMSVRFISVNPVLSDLLRVVRRVSGLSINAAVGEALRTASANDGETMNVHTNEENSARHRNEIIAAAVLYLGSRRRVRRAHVRLEMILILRRVRRILYSERVLT